MNDSSPARLQVEVHDTTGLSGALLQKLRDAIRAAAAHRGFTHGAIGLAVVDDPAIHKINLQHLQHDYPTDVISFCYEQNAPEIEGELVVSRDTAAREAKALGWAAEHELILYAVHGSLHICGLEDGTPEQRQAMRQAEQTVLQQLGIEDFQRFSPDADSQTSAQAPSQGCQS
ncbi:rRNA maturation RNase YbeY [Roseimaritima ulvae]|uniref:rRNA maturation RNase YbeY n=1 Tax=Roseimaritima ulvae TaxID=980254 RepID=UPI00082D9532|nr:rRNA maturation RNase YbeY [Roseimaritima ulvae]